MFAGFLPLAGQSDADHFVLNKATTSIKRSLQRGNTSMAAIMPLSSCSKMWQWNTKRPPT